MTTTLLLEFHPRIGRKNGLSAPPKKTDRNQQLPQNCQTGHTPPVSHHQVNAPLIIPRINQHSIKLRLQIHHKTSGYAMHQLQFDKLTLIFTAASPFPSITTPLVELAQVVIEAAAMTTSTPNFLPAIGTTNLEALNISKRGPPHRRSGCLQPDLSITQNRG